MSKVSVLVVDDATFIRDLVKKGLRDNFPGVQIEEAINGRKAQQMLSRQVVDLILCDWEMPEMSGLELLTWCREQDNLKTTPFIMVTSRGDKENVVQAIQAGVSDFIGKPFSNEQLVTKVKKALSRSGKLQALGVMSPQRSPLLPQVATMAESGFADLQLSAWVGLLAPAKTPPAVVAQLNQAVRSVLQGPARDKLLASGMEPAPSSPEELQATIAGDLKLHAELVKAAGLQPQ